MISGFSPHARGCSTADEPHQSKPKVFPACAGMFRSRNLKTSYNPCFPRMRGDVPVTQTVTQMFAKFSPHARGCSCAPCPPARNTIVFPACAGMFLQRKCQSSVPLSFPRMRGDVPAIRQRLDAGWRFSPHARGCSETAYFPISPNHVFPACAGMFRIHSLSCKRRFSFPRMRGDVPVCLAAALTSLSFSPHARGCSYPEDYTDAEVEVFPACAGMFRKFGP